MSCVLRSDRDNACEMNSTKRSLAYYIFIMLTTYIHTYLHFINFLIEHLNALCFM